MQSTLNLTPQSVYRVLQRAYPRPGGWPGRQWPVGGAFRPRRFEIVAGAILTQNTSWKNVERSLEALVSSGLTDAESIARCPMPRLQSVIRSSGFFRRKARCLKEVCRIVCERGRSFWRISREELLAVKGIGPETADSILLYACGRSRFVVDSYTRRVFGRLGLLGSGSSYARVQAFFEKALPPDLELFRAYHALIVEHARQTCRRRPLCHRCALEDRCPRSGV